VKRPGPFPGEDTMLRTTAPALAALLALATAAAAADIEYRDDKGKPTSAKGATIEEESPAGIKVKGKLIPVADLTKVVYDLPAELRLNNPLTKAAGFEDAGEFDKANKEYTEALPKLAGDQWKSTRRHVEYRLAINAATAAEEKPSEGNANLKAAADGLEKFVKDNAASWQVIPAGKALGKLQLALGQTEKAAKTFDDLGKLAGVEGATKVELQGLTIDALMSAGKYADAEKRVADLDKAIPAGDPRKPRVQVYQIACKLSSGKPEESITKLKAIIAAANDPSVLGLAYNTLGDCYRAAKNPQEARWQYLMVDQVYSADRAEQAKACERLAEVFKELKDEQRSEAFKAKASRLR
jgi:tetratricopeptide (TPR) repeat protein